jgi:hypothetical protein
MVQNPPVASFTLQDLTPEMEAFLEKVFSKSGISDKVD